MYPQKEDVFYVAKFRQIDTRTHQEKQMILLQNI